MSATGDGVFLVLCTAPPAEATALADQLLEEKLAACVNLIGPLTSRYRWEGRIEVSEEILLLIKTTAANKSALRRRIVDLHSYSVPEVLEFQVDSGLPAYLGWVTDSLQA